MGNVISLTIGEWNVGCADSGSQPMVGRGGSIFACPHGLYLLLVHYEIYLFCVFLFSFGGFFLLTGIFDFFFLFFLSFPLSLCSLVSLFRFCCCGASSQAEDKKHHLLSFAYTRIALCEWCTLVSMCGVSVAADALLKLRAELLEAAHARKAAMLSFEKQRISLFQNASETQILLAHMEMKDLFWKLWWEKLFFLQARLLSRVAHQRLVSGAERVSHGKGVLAHLVLCSPPVQLGVLEGDEGGVPQACMHVGMGTIPILRNTGVELQFRLVDCGANDNGKGNWQEFNKYYFKRIQRVPFVLTYVAGNGGLNESSSILAYAETATDGSAAYMITFPYVALDDAEINSFHTLLVTHPRTQFGMIPPLEVTLLVLAPPAIVVKDVSLNDTLTHVESHPKFQRKDELTPAFRKELQVCVEVCTDEIVTQMVFECVEKDPQGQTYVVGRKQLDAGACKRHFLEEGHWIFRCCMAIAVKDEHDEAGVALTVVVVEVTLESMSHHIFREFIPEVSLLEGKTNNAPNRPTVNLSRRSASTSSQEVSHATGTLEANGTAKDDEDFFELFKNDEKRVLMMAADDGVSVLRIPLLDQSNSTFKNMNEPEWNMRLQSYILDEDGVIGLPLLNETSLKNAAPQLVCYPYNSMGALRSGVEVPILGWQETRHGAKVPDDYEKRPLSLEWALEGCDDAPSFWLLREPGGECVVLHRPNGSRTNNSMEVCCFKRFPPLSPLSRVIAVDVNRRSANDYVVKSMFSSSLQCLVRQWASGRVTCTEPGGESMTIFDDDDDDGILATCIWNPDEEEGASLIVCLQQGRRFSIYSLDDREVILHSSLPLTCPPVGVDDADDSQEYIGVAPVLGGDAVAMWTATGVEMLFHAPTWRHQHLYTTASPSIKILGVCPAYPFPCETTEKKNDDGAEENVFFATDTVGTIVLVLLLSNGACVGLSLDGKVRDLGCLSPSFPSSPLGTLGTLTVEDLPHVSSLTMRHVKVNGRPVIFICGLTEHHVLRWAYV
ncbi:hypothetical protein MOQ_001320 [Trypanosoma cruzi marinkellei]|uniref:Uncharacterized protein n=1 Tax=Trypanosoma cruzi marinkellei TaxID=85056 RepID=K2PBH9_TRYCR|nr:hypothetical protein MOQ_001320 [Trypanosoma cruzi marinkellei]